MYSSGVLDGFFEVKGSRYRKKITIENNIMEIPDNPIIPFIEGDGIGPDIWKATRLVLDAAVEKAYNGRKKLPGWKYMQQKKQRPFMMNGCPKTCLMQSAILSSLLKDH